MTDNYIPYGVEWQKEMGKFPKAELIRMLGDALQKSEAAREYWEGQGWVRVEDGLPEEYFDGDPEMWKLCNTVFGATLLSLCHYEHKSGKWIDASGKCEERVAYWRNIPPYKSKY